MSDPEGTFCAVVNITCSSHGACDDQLGCLCDEFYTGSDCYGQWKDIYTSWDTIMLAYAIWEVLLQGSVAVIVSYQLHRIRKASPQSNYTKFILIGILIAALLRTIQYSVDPQGYRNIFPYSVNNLFFSIPIVIWIDAGCFLVLYWIELGEKARINELAVLMRVFKPLLYSICVASLFVLVIVLLWAAHIEVPIMVILFNALLGLLLIILISAYLYYGVKFLKLVEYLWNDTHNLNYKRFLRQVTFFLFLFTFFIGLVVILLLIYTVFGLRSNPIAWITIHWILRTLEACALYTALYAIGTQIPKSGNSSKDTDDTKSTVPLEMKVSNSSV